MMVHQKRYDYVFFPPHSLPDNLPRENLWLCQERREHFAKAGGRRSHGMPWNHGSRCCFNREMGDTQQYPGRPGCLRYDLRLAGDVQHTLNHALFPRKSPILFLGGWWGYIATILARGHFAPCVGYVESQTAKHVPSSSFDRVSLKDGLATGQAASLGHFFAWTIICWWDPSNSPKTLFLTWYRT